jgi:hypothetical protein
MNLSVRKLFIFVLRLFRWRSFVREMCRRSSLTISPERSPIFVPGIPTPDYDSTPDRSPSSRRKAAGSLLSSLFLSSSMYWLHHHLFRIVLLSLLPYLSCLCYISRNTNRHERNYAADKLTRDRTCYHVILLLRFCCCRCNL